MRTVNFLKSYFQKRICPQTRRLCIKNTKQGKIARFWDELEDKLDRFFFEKPVSTLDKENIGVPTNYVSLTFFFAM
ncbi:hypothetical protein LEP1GSC175_1990 [Leptospira santarosai str. HAI821]|nr:hypothetical protein LEP1GSC175_1990 [Leptospira santarosai str. HAI821]